MLFMVLWKIFKFVRKTGISKYIGLGHIFKFIRIVRLGRLIKFVMFAMMVYKTVNMLVGKGEDFYSEGRKKAAPYIEKARPYMMKAREKAMAKMEERGLDKYLDPEYYKDLMAGTCCKDEESCCCDDDEECCDDEK